MIFFFNTINLKNSKTSGVGDLGGPLVIDNKLAGIGNYWMKHPWGKPSHLPNVFTEISAYRIWIDEIINSE